MSTHNFQSEEDFIEIKGALIPDCFPNVDLYAIAYNGVYIGFIGLSQGTIEMLFIDGDCRGQGVWICTYCICKTTRRDKGRCKRTESLSFIFLQSKRIPCNSER